MGIEEAVILSALDAEKRQFESDMPNPASQAYEDKQVFCKHQITGSNPVTGSGLCGP